MKRIYLFNQHFVESSAVALHPSDLGLIRGYAIFDFFRVNNGRALFVDDYLERFFRSAESLRLEVAYSKEHLKSKIDELIVLNGVEEAGIRMLLTGGYAPDHFSLSAPSNLILMVEDFSPPPPESYQKGVSLISAEFQRLLPHIKSANYLYPIYAIPNWKEKGAEEILYKFNGQVFEASRSNIFMVKDGVVHTNEEGILWGITRKKVIELATKHFPLEIQPITYDELLLADEVFITSTTKKVMPIVEVDGCKIANGLPGQISIQLMKLFNHLEESS